MFSNYNFGCVTLPLVCSLVQIFVDFMDCNVFPYSFIKQFVTQREETRNRFQFLCLINTGYVK